MQNVGNIDRYIRLLLAILCFEAAYFWLPGAWQIAGYAAVAVMLATATLRWCPLYTLLGLRSGPRTAPAAATGLVILAGVLLLAALLGGSYASVFFSRKFFLEDFNAMNAFYKQTLFQTGKNQREKALENYNQLVPSFQQFQDKYTHYQPYVLKGDTQLPTDLALVSRVLADVNPLVRDGDLHQAHLDLEKVRPVFQEIFKRNGFSLLSVALVDFHDAMELMLDAANQKNAASLIALYPQVSDKLKAVEAEANDAEIQAIRKHLDALLSLAQAASTDTMAATGEQLKSSFIKVYLQRG
jgi:hypothetical protein